MLHMMVLTHQPESCSLAGAAQKKANDAKLERFLASPELTLKGAWANGGAHHVFLLVDAPNAHAIDRALRESEMPGWVRADVFAVEDLDTIQESLAAHWAEGSGADPGSPRRRDDSAHAIEPTPS